MTKEIKDMTKRELIAEINDMERQIQECVGRQDLIYIQQLYDEVGRRKIELKESLVVMESV